MIERVARVGEIPPGTTRCATVGTESILLCNVDGEFYAIENICTHDGAPLDQGVLDECRITCPRHGAVFDVTTGNVLALPAVIPLRTFPVHIVGDELTVKV